MIGKTKLSVIITAFFLLAAFLSFSNPVSAQAYTCDTQISCNDVLDIPGAVVQLTADISCSGNCLQFGANDVTLDGQGLYSIVGDDSGIGIDLNGNNDITIKNLDIGQFLYGIWGVSNENVLIENCYIHHNQHTGIFLRDGDYYTVFNNTIKLNRNSSDESTGYGIRLRNSTGNIISYNLIQANWRGAEIKNVTNTNITKNNIVGHTIYYGIKFESSFDNYIYYNNFISNGGGQATDDGTNTWHNGYPEGGNYWSDYDEILENCIDNNGGPAQNIALGPDGICDSESPLRGGIADKYPWRLQNRLDYIPVLEEVPTITVVENNLTMIYLEASDPNPEDTLTYSMHDYYINGGTSDQINTSTFTFDATGVTSGTHEYIAKVNDGTYNAYQTVNIEVIPAEHLVHHLHESFYTASVEGWSSAATGKLIMNYLGNNTFTETQFYNYGFQYNLDVNKILDGELDPKGMHAALGHFDPYDLSVTGEYDEYDNEPEGNPFQGYHYMIRTFDPVDNWSIYLGDIAHWMDYRPEQEYGNGLYCNPEKVPAAVPIGGDYEQWVMVNGYASNRDPLPDESDPFYMPDGVIIHGFWITDPNTDTLKNRYITAAQAQSTYFLPISSSDEYDGLLVQVAEPPPIEGELTATVIPGVIEPNPTNEILSNTFNDIQSTENRIVSIDSAELAIVEPIEAVPIPIDWTEVIPSYVLDDPFFAQAYEGAEQGRIIEVIRLGGEDYAIVTFEKQELTSASIIVEQNSGIFVEGAAEIEPTEYELLTEKEALKNLKVYLRKNRLGNLLRTKQYQTDLVWSPELTTSPFDPAWRVIVKGNAFYILSDGTVISAGNVIQEAEIEPIITPIPIKP